jgi:hypothetical protein
MSSIKCTNRVISLRGVVTAILSLGFAATAGLPSAARVGVIVQPAQHAHFAQANWQRPEKVRNYRYFNHAAPTQPGWTYTPDLPPDACDLPSTGCESYLSN